MLTLDIVGCGEVAEQFHGPVLRHLGRQRLLRVATCYDRNGARARRLCRMLRGERWATDLPQVPPASVQAALIATPPAAHADVAITYLRAGRHVLVEKPFVGSRAQAERVIEAARAGGGRALVGHMRRFYPSVRIARAFLAAGGLGVLREVTATEGGRWGGWAVASNYIVEDPLGGVLYDAGAHLLDTLLFVLGADQDPGTGTSVARVVRDREEPSQDLRAEFTLRWGSQGPLPVHFAVSRTRALAAALRITGERGTLLVPAGLAPAPRLLVEGEGFHLSQAISGPLATDALGAFEQEYLALADIARGQAGDTPLDAPRFLNLTSLLEQLASWGEPS